MRISDWSSDVCSSDLVTSAASLARLTLAAVTPGTFSSAFSTRPTQEAQVMPSICRRKRWSGTLDRKSVVSGKSVSVRVDLGGRRIIKKKHTTTRRPQQRINEQK